MTSLIFFDGAPGRIRTCDLRLRRATLYPAELRVPEGETDNAFDADPQIPSGRKASEPGNKKVRLVASPMSAMAFPVNRLVAAGLCNDDALRKQNCALLAVPLAVLGVAKI